MHLVPDEVLPGDAEWEHASSPRPSATAGWRHTSRPGNRRVVRCSHPPPVDEGTINRQVAQKSTLNQTSIKKTQKGPVWTLTSFPLLGPERVSRRAYTSPHTEISLHRPCLGSSGNPSGCITSTPLVVRPSMCPSGFFHLVAFSCAQK